MEHETCRNTVYNLSYLFNVTDHSERQDTQQGTETINMLAHTNLLLLPNIVHQEPDTPPDHDREHDEHPKLHSDKIPLSILTPSPIILLILTLGSIGLVGHKIQPGASASVEYAGNPGPNISSFRAPQPPLAWSASTSQAEVTHSPCMEHVRTLYSYGKTHQAQSSQQQAWR